jgi:hypothetical protein
MLLDFHDQSFAIPTGDTYRVIYVRQMPLRKGDIDHRPNNLDYPTQSLVCHQQLLHYLLN